MDDSKTKRIVMMLNEEGRKEGRKGKETWLEKGPPDVGNDSWKEGLKA